MQYSKYTQGAIVAFAFLALLISPPPAIAQKRLKAKDVLATMERVANWQLKTWQQQGSRHPWWDWTNAAGYTGLYALSTYSKNKAYDAVLQEKGNLMGWQTGPRRFHADDYCVGQTYALMYMRHRRPEMIAAFKAQADSIVAAPFNESLEWKNNIADREWAWCDALFMGPTSLAYLSTATGNTRYLDKALQLWWKTTDYLYDASEKLYFRDGSFLNKKEKNGQKVFWSRGNGWVFAGLVRVLQNMPANHPQRPRMIQLYKDMASRLVTLQQQDGSWRASLLDAASYPTPEMSGTAFFTYGFMWGINNRILDAGTYYFPAERGWRALVAAIQPNGMLGYVQPIGAAPDKVTANSTEIYGVGAFLLAGTEMYKWLKAIP